MGERAGQAIAQIAAVALGIEVLMNAPWIGRILSLNVLYGGTVFAIVAVRAAVTALQTAAAWMLWTGAPAGRGFGQVAFAASAVTLALEIGLRLAPSSVQPGLRGPFVAAYAVYALVAIGLLRWRANR